MQKELEANGTQLADMGYTQKELEANGTQLADMGLADMWNGLSEALKLEWQSDDVPTLQRLAASVGIAAGLRRISSPAAPDEGARQDKPTSDCDPVRAQCESNALTEGTEPGVSSAAMTPARHGAGEVAGTLCEFDAATGAWLTQFEEDGSEPYLRPIFLLSPRVRVVFEGPPPVGTARAPAPPRPRAPAPREAAPRSAARPAAAAALAALAALTRRAARQGEELARARDRSERLSQVREGLLLLQDTLGAACVRSRVAMPGARVLVALDGASAGPPPPPPLPSRTNWTRLVPPSVLTGHVSAQSRRHPRRRQARRARAVHRTALRAAGAGRPARCALLPLSHFLPPLVELEPRRAREQLDLLLQLSAARVAPPATAPLQEPRVPGGAAGLARMHLRRWARRLFNRRRPRPSRRARARRLARARLRRRARTRAGPRRCRSWRCRSGAWRGAQWGGVVTRASAARTRTGCAHWSGLAQRGRRHGRQQ